jgi:hypothetical protein
MMLESFTKQILEKALSGYTSGLESMAQARAAELASIKSKVRSNPEEVEAWFERELEKVNGIDVSEMLRKAVL